MYEADLGGALEAAGLGQPADMDQASQVAAAAVMLSLVACRYGSHADRARGAAAAAEMRRGQAAAAAAAAAAVPKRRVTVEMLAPPLLNAAKAQAQAAQAQAAQQQQQQDQEQVQVAAQAAAAGGPLVVAPEVYALLGARYLASQGVLYGVFISTGNMAASLAAGLAMQLVQSLFSEVSEDLGG
jgi:hypothetical protein